MLGEARARAEPTFQIRVPNGGFCGDPGKCMDPFECIALAGQGEPLPSDFPYKGQWLLENRIFLYRSDGAQPSGTGALNITASGPSPDGKPCFGLDAGQLALAFQITTEQVFKHNRSHTLFLANVEDVPATHGFIEAKLYIFQIGSYRAAVTVERARRGGNA